MPKPLRLEVERPSEAEIQRLVMNRLRAWGWLTVRVNGGGFRDDNGRFVPCYIVQGLMARSGFPDIVAFRLCRFLLLEIKDHKGRLNPAQQKFHMFARRFGVEIHVIRHVDELNPLLEDMDDREQMDIAIYEGECRPGDAVQFQEAASEDGKGKENA